jgi:integrase
MPRLLQRLPAYCLHKHSGQAIVTLNGFDHYLGTHGSEESRRQYDRLIAEWLAAGRSFAPPASISPSVGRSIDEIILAFWQHAETYYVSGISGRPTTELDHFRQALRHLHRLYGNTPANDFGPKALAALREVMVTTGWSRGHINHQVRRIVMVFKYAASQELVHATVHAQLKTLAALKRGRSLAREMPPKKPVPPELIAAVQPFVSRQVWAMIQLQLLSACRPGEIVKLRPTDINRTGNPWRYVLGDHKTAHHGKTKTIYFGRRAQEVLRPFLENRIAEAFVFSPREAESERRQIRHRRRKTALTCGNSPNANRKAGRRAPAERYSEASYRRAIARACEAAFPPPEDLRRSPLSGRAPKLESKDEWRSRLGPANWMRLSDWQKDHHWHPHQLRNNAATNIRAEFGIEMAQAAFGNSSIAMAELYAEINHQKVSRVMAEIG